MVGLIFIAVGILGFVFFWRRIDAVFDERLRVISVLFERAQESARKGEDWKYYRKPFDEISFNEMVYTFWKPVGSFFKDIK